MERSQEKELSGTGVRIPAAGAASQEVERLVASASGSCDDEAFIH
jgi:hypothetical protein